MKKMPKKGLKSQKLPKNESEKYWCDQKGADQVANSSCFKVLYYNGLIACKVSIQ